MKINFSVLFFLKKPKNYTKGAVYFIFLRITVDGIRAEMSTSRNCEPDRWNAKVGKVIGTKEDVKTLNAYLENMKAEVYAAHSQLNADGTAITADNVKCKFLGKAEKTHTIMEAIKIHNTNMAALVEKEDYAEGTLRRFKVLEKHVKEYLLFKYQTSDLNIRHIDHEFIDGFDFYLHTSKDNDTNTASKHLKNLGKIVRICLRNKWIITDPFFGYKLKSKLVQREYLTADELQNIAGKKYSTARLSQVRDFFLFSCYTGLSYADVQKLKQTDIRIGIDGEKWLFSYRKKTGTPVAVPLIPIAADILERYKDHPFCANQNRALPISSNQKMNEYLVEIAALSGIVKTLGNRIAKRTFATTVTLLNGVPIESVSKMMGHTNIRTTQLYAKMLDEKVASDMAPLREMFAVV
ncbi:Site-specific recombinase XerD [Pedobacter westerhofensis]|uniref:Site-specific recombinase XerD n=1 Tax=Pedobacter westerhofensis TaxID=425512 RepID=A0A521FV14_9SPHI|nr:site-specific integrase [Pedobacter westerhofensis]SMP00007.1 Site-specific recombinase XerD [Pedobacter westerhofensis]